MVARKWRRILSTKHPEVCAVGIQDEYESKIEANHAMMAFCVSILCCRVDRNRNHGSREPAALECSELLGEEPSRFLHAAGRDRFANAKPQRVLGRDAG